MVDVNISMEDVEAAMRANPIVSLSIRIEALSRMVQERNAIIAKFQQEEDARAVANKSGEPGE